MIFRITLLAFLIMTGACSSPPEEQVEGRQPVRESEMSISKSLEIQADQLLETSNKLQALVDEWEKNNE